MKSCRRSLLKVMACSPLFLNVAAIAGNITDKKKQSTTMLTSYRAQWFELEIIFPLDYINEVQNNNIIKLSHQELITKDFVDGNTLCLNGFVLSKYEAAHMAELINCV